MTPGKCLTPLLLGDAPRGAEDARQDECAGVSVPSGSGAVGRVHWVSPRYDASGADATVGFFWESWDGRHQGFSGYYRIFLTTPGPHHPSLLQDEMDRFKTRRLAEIERDIALGAI